MTQFGAGFFVSAVKRAGPIEPLNRCTLSTVLATDPEISRSRVSREALTYPANSRRHDWQGNCLLVIWPGPTATAEAAPYGFDPTPMLDRPGSVNAHDRKLPRSCRQLQNIRLGSAAANLLSKSRNQRADEDG